jgi:hypothetical protein
MAPDGLLVMPGPTRPVMPRERAMNQFIELSDFDCWIEAIYALVKKGVTCRAFTSGSGTHIYKIELTGGF